MAEGWKVWEGTTVDGRFLLEEYLGGSGHSAVFRTRCENAPAVIKFVPASSGFVALAKTSWDSVVRLSHPHLLRLLLHGVCRLGDTQLLYVVMEAADEDLAQVLQGRALPPEEVQEFLPAVLNALDYLHTAGFAHAGLKPSNILAVHDQLKLSPDSIRPLGTSASEVEASAFNAPELSTGAFSTLSDIWSLGATLANVLTGRPAGVSNPAKAAPDSLSEPFRSIVSGCLAASSAERWSLARVREAFRPAALPMHDRAVVKPPAAEPGRVASPPAKPDIDAAAVLERAGNDQVPGSSNLRRLWILAVSFVLILFAIYGASLLRHRESLSTAPPPNPATDANQPSAKTEPAPTMSPDPALSSGTAKATGYNPGSILNKVMPDVSSSARATIQGRIRVVVEAQVDETGKVIDAKITKSGPSQYFASHALAAARKFTFAPARSGGQAVPSRWDLHFVYSRHGTTVDARNEQN